MDQQIYVCVLDQKIRWSVQILYNVLIMKKRLHEDELTLKRSKDWKDDKIKEYEH